MNVVTHILDDYSLDSNVDLVLVLFTGFLVFMLPWRNAVVLFQSLPIVGPVTIGKAFGVVVGCLWLATLLASREVPAIPRGTLFFGAFVLWSALTLLWSVNTTRGLVWVTSFAMSLGLSLVLYDVASTYGSSKPYLWMLFFGILVSSFGILSMFALGLDWNDKFRYTFSFGPNASAILVDLSGILFGYLLRPFTLERGKTKIHLAAVVGYLSYVVWIVSLTGSRQGLVLFLPVFVFNAYVIYFYTDIRSAERNRRYTLISSLGLCLLAFIFFYSLLPPATQQRISQLPMMIANFDLNSRLTVWAIGFDLWIKKPVGGLGAGSFATLATETIQENTTVVADTIPVDNTYLSILYNLGLVGAILWGSFALHVVKSLWTRSAGVQRMFNISVLVLLGVAAGLKAWHNEPIFYLVSVLLLADTFPETSTRTKFQEFITNVRSRAVN